MIVVIIIINNRCKDEYSFYLIAISYVGSTVSSLV